MKTARKPLLLFSLLAALSAVGASSEKKAQTLKTFTTADQTISKEATVTDEKEWLVDAKKAQVIRLFEVADPNVEQCMVIYRAKLKTEGLTEPAYLEMWCRFPGKGEYFSRGLDNTVTGSNNCAFDSEHALPGNPPVLRHQLQQLGLVRNAFLSAKR